MLKKSASSVLASFRASTLRKGFSEVGSTVGAFPFAKIHPTGERPTRSAVCTSSGLHSLRPCWTNFLSILRDGSHVVPYVRTIEVLACQHSFPQPAKLSFCPRLVIQCGMSQWCRLCLSLALWRIPAARKRRHPRPRFRVKPYSLHKLRRVPNFPARPMSSPHQGRVLGLALRRIHVPGRGLVPPDEDSLGCQADRRSRDRWGPRIPQAGTCAPR